MTASYSKKLERLGVLGVPQIEQILFCSIKFSHITYKQFGYWKLSGLE
jgi:hypothetical protein